MHGNFRKYIILLTGSGLHRLYRELADSLEQCTFVFISDHEDANTFFKQEKVDLVLLNHTRNIACIDTLKYFKSVKPSVPVIVMANTVCEEFVVQAYKCGARDYFRKPFDAHETKKSIRHVLSFRHAMNRRKADYAPDSFRASVDYIFRNYDRNIKLHHVVKEAGMSTSCYERTFKRSMGLTYTMFVNNLRIAKAVTLLKENSFTTSEIAYACGFTNQFHFTRMFKKIMKHSPRKFKKIHL